MPNPYRYSYRTPNRRKKFPYVWLIFLLFSITSEVPFMLIPIGATGLIFLLVYNFVKGVSEAASRGSSQTSSAQQANAQSNANTSQSASSRASSSKSTAKKERSAGSKHKIWGKFLKVLGVLVGVSGIISVVELITTLLSTGLTAALLRSILITAIILFGGGASFFSGVKMQEQGELYDKYAAVIGDRDAMLIKDIAAAIPTSPEKAAKDLQKLIASGDFGTKAYINSATGNFMRSSAASPIVDPDLAKKYKKQQQDDANLSEGERIARELRLLNDAIPDPDISAQIDRIEELTADIFKLLEENPAKRTEVTSFLDYYLPTTLKLLTAYSKFDDAAASGENIEGAKRSIASILDTLINGFSQQLDRLYASDAMDIDSDIRVLEQMMERDGLKAGKGSLDALRNARKTAGSAGSASAAATASAPESETKQNK